MHNEFDWSDFMSAYFSRRRTFERLYFPQEMVVVPTIRYSSPIIQYRSVWDFTDVDSYRHNNAFNAGIIRSGILFNSVLSNISDNNMILSKLKLFEYLNENRFYN
jgi:hypothetical protein